MSGGSATLRGSELCAEKLSVMPYMLILGGSGLPCGIVKMEKIWDMADILPARGRGFDEFARQFVAPGVDAG